VLCRCTLLKDETGVYSCRPSCDWETAATSMSVMLMLPFHYNQMH